MELSQALQIPTRCDINSPPNHCDPLDRARLRVDVTQKPSQPDCFIKCVAVRAAGLVSVRPVMRWNGGAHCSRRTPRDSLSWSKAPNAFSAAALEDAKVAKKGCGWKPGVRSWFWLTAVHWWTSTLI